MSKVACTALALLAEIPCSARAAEGPALDGSLLDRSEAQLDLMRRDYSPRYGRRNEPQARQGLLLSFGLGGGSLYLSNEGPGRLGAADVDFRLGYGFSDRFQMFMDFNTDVGRTNYGNSVGSWTWTLRAQTVLVGDRAGNGLNANFGAGFGDHLRRWIRLSLLEPCRLRPRRGLVVRRAPHAMVCDQPRVLRHLASDSQRAGRPR